MTVKSTPPAKVSFGQLMAYDARLAAAGISPFTPWWKAQLKRFYSSPTARQLVARVGRGGAKSHTATKCLVIEAVAGDWNIPPGERHYAAFVSINKSEAAQRLDLVGACLTALGEPFTRSGDELLMVNRPIGFRTFACTVGAVSGWRCIGFSDDELAKQMADPDAAEPAHEVLASLRAMCVTHPEARKFLISSPMGHEDEHATTFDKGNTSHQVVCQGASWEANPSISQEQTEADEPDRRVWLREYAAEPQDSVLAAFDSDLIDEALKVGFPYGEFYRFSPRVLIADPSAGGGDSWAYCLAQWAHPAQGAPADCKPILGMHEFHAWHGKWRENIDDAQLGRELLTFCRTNGVRTVISDGYDVPFMRSVLCPAGITFRPIHWGATEQDHASKTPLGVASGSKLQAGLTIRRWLQGRCIKIMPDEKDLQTVRRQLLRFKEKITPSGGVIFEGGRGHDDFAALVMTCAMGDSLGYLPGGTTSAGLGISTDALESFIRMNERLSGLERGYF